MALAPKFAAACLRPAKAIGAIHTIELYLDYVCPFSKKMFETVYTKVWPLCQQKYDGKVQFILRQLVQPWHPSSTLVHEAALAVLRLTPAKYYPFSAALFARQTDYFDLNVHTQTRNETYGKLATLAHESCGVDAKKMEQLLCITDEGRAEGKLNVGNGVTDDLKVVTKAGRLVGVHVTPSVVFDGIMENSISSGMSVEEWDQWLEKNVA